METQSVAAPIIMVAAAIGTPLCLLAAYVAGIGGLSGSRNPMLGALVALGAVSLPAVGFALLRGNPSWLRIVLAVITGAVPLATVLTVVIRIVWSD